MFQTEVIMWVFEEVVNGQRLSDVINEKHENIKYLPGVKLPTNVVCMYNRMTSRLMSELLISYIHTYIGPITPCPQQLGCLMYSLVCELELSYFRYDTRSLISITLCELHFFLLEVRLQNYAIQLTLISCTNA